MSRQDKRNMITLATFFVMLLIFCVKAAGVHIPMAAGLVFIAVLMVYTIRRWEGVLKCPYAFR